MPTSIIAIDGVDPGESLRSPGNKKFALSNLGTPIPVTYLWEIVSYDIPGIDLELTTPTEATCSLQRAGDSSIRKSGAIVLRLTTTIEVLVFAGELNRGSQYSLGDNIPVISVDGNGSGAVVEVDGIDTPVGLEPGMINSLDIINPGSGYTLPPVLDFSGAGDGTATGTTSLLTTTSVDVVTITIQPKTAEFFAKRCSTDDGLDFEIKMLRSDQADAINDANDAANDVDSASAIAAIEDLTDTVQELYNMGSDCNLDKCEYSRPSSDDDYEAQVYTDTGLIVLGGQLALPLGYSLRPLHPLYGMLTEEYVQSKPQQHTSSLAVISDLLGMPPGSFVFLMSENVAVTTSACGDTTKREVREFLIWSKSNPVLQKWPSGDPVTISDVMETYSIEDGDLVLDLFWCTSADLSGGAYGMLQNIGLDDDQLVVALIGDNPNGEFNAGTLNVWELEPTAISSLEAYGLSDNQIEKLLARAVDGIDTEATTADLLEFLEDFIATPAERGDCGPVMESRSSLILDVVDTGETFIGPVLADLDACKEQADSLDSSLGDIIGAISTSISDTSSSFSSARSTLSSAVRTMEGLESELWRAIDPDGNTTSNVLSCLLSGTTFGLPGIPGIPELVDLLLLAIPGSITPVEIAIKAIIKSFELLGTPVCITNELIEQTLGAFGISFHPVLSCFTSLETRLDIENLLAQIPCLLESLAVARSVMEFLSNLIRALRVNLRGLLGNLKALSSGIEIRFKQTSVCSGSTGAVKATVQTFSNQLVGALGV